MFTVHIYRICLTPTTLVPLSSNSTPYLQLLFPHPNPPLGTEFTIIQQLTFSQPIHPSLSQTKQLAAVVVSNYRTPDELVATGSNGKHAVVMVKGAPEHILSLCTHYLDQHGHAQVMK